ncbi:hypothetical protein [Aquimarina algicola]|uniref:Uncharacterized protein n=1 Tax=Aquimarina algicola TaxID=2589995 RepID=A0A504JB35_9FLAO|nr:hypothetical protein [Aquimarina algicola]TPN83491.1 hypothetical protein FHK87_19940 [Aquimarina algicola]
MLKSILNLDNVSKLQKSQQKIIVGGELTGSNDCALGGDFVCCGNQPWQCGTGPLGGGDYINGTCFCFA